MNGYNFTERVRRVLAGARDEANKLRHEYVGTEHILLGLITYDDGVAGAVLQNLKTDLNAATQLIKQTVQPGKAGAPTGPDLPYTSRAKKVIELAMSEAKHLGHNYVGTEHLLLGLLIEEKGIAAQVLTHLGLTVDTVRAEVVKLIGEAEGVSLRPDANQGVSFSAEVSAMFPGGLDALEAAPEFHSLLLENDQVRVLETQIPPGRTTPMHTHRYPAVHYFKSWSHFIRRNDRDEVLVDTRQTDFAKNPPQVLWGAALPPHTVENVGDATLHVISVEIKASTWRGV